jgi:hypothetical protein
VRFGAGRRKVQQLGGTMQKKKKFGLGIIFWLLVFDVAFFWLDPTANFEETGIWATALMSSTSLLLWVMMKDMCIPSDQEINRYVHRIAKDLAIGSAILTAAHHFIPATVFPGVGAVIVLLLAFALTAEYRRFIRVTA